MTYDQWFIATLGTLSALLLIRGEGRWALIAALAGQPAWIYAAIAARQWGILYISVIYTIVWCLLLRREDERRKRKWDFSER